MGLDLEESISSREQEEGSAAGRASREAGYKIVNNWACVLHNGCESFRAGVQGGKARDHVLCFVRTLRNGIEAKMVKAVKEARVVAGRTIREWEWGMVPGIN